MMSRVRSKDSKAEMLLRRRLHALGLRYRLHASDVAGKPDILLRKSQIAVFVDGDFWHGNAWRLRGLPSLEALFPTRTDWWVAKIQRNMERDREVTTRLEREGWCVLRFWESTVLDDPDAVASKILGTVHELRDPGVQERHR